MNEDAPRYVTIAGDLRARIKGLSPGEALTPIPELCQQYDCARGTMRKALLVLQAEGLIERYPGIGWCLAGAGDMRLYIRLADDLRDQIRTGQLQPGSRVSMNALHVRRGLSLPTIAKAVKILVAEELVAPVDAGNIVYLVRAGEPTDSS